MQFTEAGVKGLNMQSKTACIGWCVRVGVGQGSNHRKLSCYEQRIDYLEHTNSCTLWAQGTLHGDVARQDKQLMSFHNTDITTKQAL